LLLPKAFPSVLKLLFKYCAHAIFPEKQNTQQREEAPTPWPHTEMLVLKVSPRALGEAEAPGAAITLLSVLPPRPDTGETTQLTLVPREALGAVAICRIVSELSCSWGLWRSHQCMERLLVITASVSEVL
jgi:hypothetical protein